MLFACTMANRMIFLPPEPSYGQEDQGVVSFGEGDEFSGFYFPAESADAPTLLWAHGNGEDAGSSQWIAARMQAKGIGMMVYDYPGYGYSEGKPNEKGVYRSADAAFDFLTKKQGRSPKSVVIVGQSVGSGPSVYLAEKGEAAGVILISPFKSAFRVVTRVKLMPWDVFDNWKRIKSMDLPLLVVHGDADEVVPYSHGEALFNRYEGEKEFIRLEGVGHNDLWPRANGEVIPAIVEFAEKVAS